MNAVRLLWSRELAAPPLGLSLAREAGVALVFDAERMLTRLDRAGQVALRRPAPATPAAALVSDDGRFVAALGRRGQVWLLSAEFDVIWQRSLPRRPVALALDHLGNAVAVSDEAGGLHVFDARGQQVWSAQVARPLAHLAWVPEGGALLGAADLGLLCAHDRRGKCLWREGLMAHVGSLAVSGMGERVVAACFGEGLCCYALDKPPQVKLPKTAGSRLAAVAYRGEPIVSVGSDNRLVVRNGTGQVLGEWVPPGAPSALALAALGERALLIVDRAVLCVETAIARS